MKKLIVVIKSLMIFSIMSVLMSGSCCKDCDPCEVKETRNVELIFNALNLSAEGSKPAYTGSPVVTNTQNITITVNGVSQNYSVTTKSYELPVSPGDEIEIQFKSSFDEEIDATFTLTGGTVHKVTTDAPSFKWIVPEGVKSGDKIIGKSHYETECFIYEGSGEITLIAVEK